MREGITEWSKQEYVAPNLNLTFRKNTYYSS